MTLTNGQTRVRNLLDQTDTANTQYDNTDFIAAALNQGRRMFARILPASVLPELRTTGSLTVTSGKADFPADYLRDQEGVRVQIDAAYANDITTEPWRLKYLESNDLTKSANGDTYYWKNEDGVEVLPTASTTVTYPYVKMPADLDGTDNGDLPDDVEDLTVDFAFEKCMMTKRGDLELAVTLAKNRGFTLRAIYGNL